MADKDFIRADDLVRDAFALARAVYDSGFLPEVLLVLWRGGTPVGIVIHEFMLYKGVQTYHTVVKAESYVGIGTRVEPRIEGMAALLPRIARDARVLVVDDIFDSGCTMKRVIELLAPRTTNVRIATLYVKTGANVTDLTPDYFHRETDRWIVFPHELEGLTDDEIKAKDSRIYDLITA